MLGWCERAGVPLKTLEAGNALDMAVEQADRVILEYGQNYRTAPCPRSLPPSRPLSQHQEPHLQGAQTGGCGEKGAVERLFL